MSKISLGFLLGMVLLRAFVASDGGLIAANCRGKLEHPMMKEEMPWQRLGVSQQAYEDFESFWDVMESRGFGEQFAIPRVVIWLNGAPGAGKGTNSGYIQNVFGVTSPPLVVSDLLASDEFKAIKDSGKLVSDAQVTSLLFRKLLSKPYGDGAIVDGYPRTTVQAECVKLLYDKILSMKQRTNFQVVILDVSEKVSIERQLGRGARAVRNNERVRQTGQGTLVPLRKTDVDPEAAKIRYQVFMQQTDDALNVLQHEFPCYRIQADGSFEQVKANIYQAFQSADE